MPSSFQQYQGGIQPVQGISEAGANIGKMYQQGLSSLGSGIAEGIKAYQNNAAANDLVTQQGDAIAGQLMYFRQIASQSPENAALIPMLDKSLEQFKTFHTKSLPQKQGILTSGQVTLQQFLPNYQLNQQVQAQRAQNDLGRALRETPSVKEQETNFFVDAHPIEATKPVSQQLEVFLTNAKNKKAKDGAATLVGDSELISRWVNANQKKVNDAVTAGQLPADVAGRLNDQLNSLKSQRESENMGIQGGLEDFMKSEYDTAWTAPEKKPLSSESNKKIDEINAQIEQLKKVKESGNYVKPDVIQSGISNLVNEEEGSVTKKAVDTFNLQSLKSMLEFSNRFSDVTPDDIKKYIKETSDMGGFSIAPQMLALAAGSSPVIGSIRKPLTEAQDKLLKSEYDKAKQSEFDKQATTGRGFIGETFMGQKTPDQRIAELEQIKKNIQQPKTEQAKQEQPKPPAPIGGGSLIAGTTKEQTPMTTEEKRTQVENWFKNNKEYGYIPSAFNQLWTNLNPQPKITKNQETGTYWIADEKGNFKQVDMPKGPSTEDLALNRAIQYGNYDANGNPAFEERIKGSGILTQGVLRSANPKKEAPEFEDQIKATADVRRLVKELLPYYDSKTNALRPEKYKEVVPILNKLRAAVRPEIIGTGQQNEAERKQVIDAVGTPENFWSFLSGEKKKLLMLERMQMEGLVDNKFGITVKFKDSSENEFQSNVSEARRALNTSR